MKINRFPGSFSICKKDDLVINYKWLQQRAGSYKILDRFRFLFSGAECFNFLPESYALPLERREAVEAIKADEEESLWIVKPSNQACGEGIFLITRSGKHNVWQ